MVFQPGQSGNPRGRKPGTRVPGKKTKLSLREIANRGDVDTIDFLSTVVSGEKFGMPLRLQAAGLLAPYQHSRCTARHVSTPVELPVPDTVERATENIAKLSVLAASGEIGLDEANDLASLQKSYIEAKVGLDIELQMVELRQIVERLSASARPIEATISGGLGVLPGTRIDMPVLGGPNGGEPEAGE